jgi:putative N6-adenine-specific DNA methylase
MNAFDSKDQNKQTKDLTITIKTFYGFEGVLKEELEELGFDNVTQLNRAVQIQGSWRDVYYLNVHLRCALSVLVQVRKFNIRTEDDLYKQCMKIDWTSYFDVSKTFAVKGAVYSDFFKHSQFPFLLVKDAIVDTFRKKLNTRPDVHTKKPQVMFDVYINNREVTISLNTSGAPLFQRGYRDETGIAPMNEVTAAGLIRMSGWDRKSPFVDPFCGSGTFLIEAALMAAGLPATIERQHYAFKNFANFDRQTWEEIQDAIPRRVTSLPCEIYGSDKNAEMVMKARRNLRRLPLGRFVQVSPDSFDEVKRPSTSGVMLTNPPYGERMGDEIEELYEQLGDWMKNEMHGFSCWIVSSNMEAFKSVGLKPTKKLKVFNGSLECSFRKYEIYEGSKKGKFNNSEA